MTPQTPSNEMAGTPDNEVMIAMLGTMTSLYSRSTVGALALTGLVRITLLNNTKKCSYSEILLLLINSFISKQYIELVLHYLNLKL